eukprot:CAMPEP_0172548290 /NCGR_PEP_ID=MMETSP1067-20121228/17623_1 /TAXON_ID=265564 ORGANISM="Thalassiosira punctigera, Strain Tpunct2005C2" /NCGR_SAMPLE_ID=MMETSP1067 /ASSEMBLY_ACC=CAM_ASM_000444 /LENGTH=65 /DNA_ID=CAMNT_0013335491 /DNA_START=27 /DNA_END=224 /DNA_ORIENTATION=+
MTLTPNYQGCYHAQAWNEDANGDEDARASTQRLVRFCLYPAETCSVESASSFASAYFESIKQGQE